MFFVANDTAFLFLVLYIRSSYTSCPIYKKLQYISALSALNFDLLSNFIVSKSTTI